MPTDGQGNATSAAANVTVYSTAVPWHRTVVLPGTASPIDPAVYIRIQTPNTHERTPRLWDLTRSSTMNAPTYVQQAAYFGMVLASIVLFQPDAGASLRDLNTCCTSGFVHGVATAADHCRV